MGVKGDWLQQFGWLDVAKVHAKSGEGACEHCLFSSLSLLSLFSILFDRC